MGVSVLMGKQHTSPPTTKNKKNQKRVQVPKKPTLQKPNTKHLDGQNKNLLFSHKKLSFVRWDAPSFNLPFTSSPPPFLSSSHLVTQVFPSKNNNITNVSAERERHARL